MQPLKKPNGKIYNKTNVSFIVAKILAVLLAFFVLFNALSYLNSHFAKIIVGQSMEPTLNADPLIQNEKDIVLVDKYAERKRGDIVIINVRDMKYFVETNKHKETPTKLLVKRIIALGGEKIKIKFNSEISKNEIWIKNSAYPQGFKLEENYIAAFDSFNITWNQTDWDEICEVDADGFLTIPQNCFFCLGDNRDNSIDSRRVGPFSAENVWGVVDYIVKDGTLLHSIVATLCQFDL